MRQCPRCSSRYEDAVGFCPRDGTGLEEIKDSLIGQEVGHYKITSLIGEGGMGAVYLAVHPQIGSRVAVKVLHPDLARDRAAVDRFFSEARSVNLIRHENIVNILDLAQLADGRSYIVMECLEGESVAARLRKKGPFSPKEAVALMLPVMAALQAAHEHGIIHRDLKPDNIFLTRGGQVKVLDFGIAKLDIAHGGGAATRTGAILGTPMYMSPEQAAGRASQVDHRSDIYSAGIILHELIAGKVPFISDALYDLITKHLTEPPPPLRTLRPDCPPELEALVLRALAKERDTRFPTAAAMAEALQQVADLIAARPATAAAAVLGASPSGAIAVGPTLTPSYAAQAGALPPTQGLAAGVPSGYGAPPAPSHFGATPPTAYAGTPPPVYAPTPLPPTVTPPLAAMPYPAPTPPAPMMAPGPPRPPGTMGGAAPVYAPPPARSSSGGVAAIVVVLVVAGLAAAYGMKLFPFQKQKPVVAAQDAGVALALAEQADAAAVIPIGTVDAGPLPGVNVKVSKTGVEVVGVDKGHDVKKDDDKKKREKEKKEKEKKDKPDGPKGKLAGIDDVFNKLGKERPHLERLEKTQLADAAGISGTYSGRIMNLTTKTRSTGVIKLAVVGATATGYLTVHPPLAGSGPITGRIQGKQVFLTVRAADGSGTIQITGSLIGNTLTGGFSAAGPMLVGGAQRGSFTMRKP
jgi:hypothetical protein